MVTDALDGQRRREISRSVNVADHSGVAAGNLHQLSGVAFEQRASALIAAQGLELGAKAPGDTHRMTATGAEVRHRKQIGRASCRERV